MNSFTLLLSLASLTLAAPHTRLSWAGWKNVKYMFVFGDSYTQTGFHVNGTQPSPANPMGNPPYPGWTSANGPNWVGFLTNDYNTTYVQTYNLAYGGATVDSALVAPWRPDVLSLKNQIQDLYLPNYGSAPAHVPWKASNSLFAFWIGINDVGNTWWLNNSTLYDAIFTQYDGLLEQVYKTGARNFLFLNVPPIHLAPLTLANGPEAVAGEEVAIKDWNARLRRLSAEFRKRHPGVVTFVHKTYDLYIATIEEPTTYPQTSGLKNTTGFCEVYANGTPTWYTKDESCEHAVHEYLWLNSLHPTFPAHNSTAASIAQLLKKQL
ncbi:carbohydrate esterase family 16 protein [Sporormia fimetaria CBS 119925]|uniref:Carbohydrate esterase family 16 protein n=1 Tax=Sporormia fimetaria CBS 119925 TaxID=1340428 RepID=A0A6A6VJ82_9PLEO|nr:carbohydrate esterase family 16 protein [Sporormia fimetaria CBS 119925]